MQDEHLLDQGPLGKDLSEQDLPGQEKVPALAIEGLSKAYTPAMLALDNITLKVQPGDFFALLGPNGAGKSTLIAVVCSLIKKTQGHVKVFGVDIDRDLSLAKQYIGLVPQEFNFNQFEKVFDVVATQAGFYGVPKKQAAEKTEYLLHSLGLWEKRQEYSRYLSGGMKRRLMIARALVHDPRLLILDEPTAGVDIELRRSMWDFLTETNQAGTTIILTTHYLEEAEFLCRNVAIINHGKLIKHAPVKEVVASLDQETFVLDLVHACQQNPLQNSYQSRLLADNTQLEITLSREDSLTQVLSQLHHQQIEVCSMKNKTNRLEELFVSLVQEHAPGASAPITNQPRVAQGAGK